LPNVREEVDRRNRLPSAPPAREACVWAQVWVREILVDPADGVLAHRVVIDSEEGSGGSSHVAAFSHGLRALSVVATVSDSVTMLFVQSANTVLESHVPSSFVDVQLSHVRSLRRAIGAVKLSEWITSGFGALLPSSSQLL